MEMAATPPATGAASGAPIIGTRGDAAATANACPQFGQDAAPSAITPPHLEQYTGSPRTIFWSSSEPANFSQILLSTWVRVNPALNRMEWQEFHSTSTRLLFAAMPLISRITLILEALPGAVQIHIVLVQFVPFVSRVTYNSLLEAACTQPLAAFPMYSCRGVQMRTTLKIVLPLIVSVALVSLLFASSHLPRENPPLPTALTHRPNTQPSTL